MPVTPGNVVRVYTEAGPQQPRKYQPGTCVMPVTLFSLIIVLFPFFKNSTNTTWAMSTSTCGCRGPAGD